MKSIEEINQDYLCTGCGTCVAACPNSAITMKIKNGQYYPEVKNDICVGCSRCVNVCPGISVSMNSIAEKIWPENKYNSDLGRFISTYIGYSKDDKIRFSGASGGLVTSIVIYLLKNNIVDGAILTKMDENNPLLPKSFIAYTEEEVLLSQTSKYCPTSPVQVLKDLKSEKDKTFVFVGLPCHIHGLRKLEQQEQWLSERIKLTIGLFCSHGVTFLGTEFLLNKFAYGKDNLYKFRYRGGGWPGGLQIKYISDNVIKIPLRDYWAPFFSNYHFTPYRCLTCCDLAAELADISVGDAWLDEIKQNDNIGTSVLISRSEFANSILRNMYQSEYIYLSSLDYKKVIESQKGILLRKKKGVGSRLKLFRLLLKPTPTYDQDFKHSMSGIFGSILIYINSYASKNKYLQILLQKLPKKYFILNTNYAHKYGGK